MTNIVEDKPPLAPVTGRRFFRCLGGTPIENAFIEAWLIAMKEKCDVEFEHNQFRISIEHVKS